MRHAVSAGWVLPVDGPPVENGFVAWEDGRIVEIGRGRGDRHYEDALILPGLVNAHSHLEYAVYAGFGDGEPFGDWLATHIGRKRKLDARRHARDRAARRRRVARTRDHHHRRLQLLRRRSDAADELGLRAIVYLEVFGGDPARPSARFDDLRASVHETELVRLGVSPHAPYTCSLDVYRWCLSLGIPVGTHLAESDGENEWLEHGTGPLSAAATCSCRRPGSAPSRRSTTSSAPSSSARTASTVDADEIDVLAAADVPVAHCPRSNALLGCGIAPLAALRAAGIRVGLGTDSPASTPSFDAFDELRAALPARAPASGGPMRSTPPGRSPRYPGCSARARPRSRPRQPFPGKRADLTVVSVAGSPYHPIEDPAVAAVFGGSPGRRPRDDRRRKDPLPPRRDRVARGTQHRKRRPQANARVAARAAGPPPKPKRPAWEDQLFFARLRNHGK